MRAKGEGSIYRRDDGRWVAQIDAGRYPNGRRRYLRRVRPTKKAAGQALADLRRQAGTRAAADAITVTDWCHQWLDDCRVRWRAGQLAPTTVVGYERHVRLYIVPTLGHLRLDRVTVGDVRRLITAVMADGKSATTAGSVRATISAALSAAIQDDLIELNVAAATRPPPKRAAPPSAFAPDEFVRIMEVCETHPDGDLVVFAVDTGLRTSELLGLEWAGVDLDGRAYQVREGLHRIGPTGAHVLDTQPGRVGAKPKNPLSGAPTPMSEIATAALRRQRVRQAEQRLAAGPAWVDTGRVFAGPHGEPLDDSALRRRFRRLLTVAGVDTHTADGRGRALHELRRTFATRLRERGVSVEHATRLGRWTSAQMLLQLYRAVDEQQLRRVVDGESR